MKYRLIFRGDFLQQIHEYFYPVENFSMERFAVIFLAPSRTPRTRTLISAELLIPEQDDYADQGATGLVMKDGFVNRYYQYCADNSYSLLTLHSHPFDKSHSNFFSGIDDRSDHNQFSFFRLLVSDGFFVAGVMNSRKKLTVRVFDSRFPKSSGIEFDEILYTGFPLKKEFPSKALPGVSSSNERVYDRQIRVFGREGQRQMEMLRIGIVGVGGMGSVLIEILARMGVRYFSLIDHDIADWTNLNRFTGMYENDVQKKRPKVRIAKRLVKKINPLAKVSNIETEVYSNRAVSALKQTDIIFLCTDNATSRDFINKFCIQYITPCISLGSVITCSRDTKEIISALGEVIVMVPGSNKDKFCLTCSGAINTDLLKLENAPGNLSERLHGYIHGDQEPAPAVRYLNGIVADLAAAEFHNLICNFKAPSLYQHINLIPEKDVYDDFFLEDFENFLLYLLSEGIIISSNETLRHTLINELTWQDDEDGIIYIRKDIEKEIFKTISGDLSEKGIIAQERKDAFLEEISLYFSSETTMTNGIVHLVDVKQEKNDCHICGPMAFLMGQGDLVELKKFSY
jgi:molybdopterin-synthase adenylyltransferase